MRDGTYTEATRSTSSFNMAPGFLIVLTGFLLRAQVGKRIRRGQEPTSISYPNMGLGWKFILGKNSLLKQDSGTFIYQMGTLKVYSAIRHMTATCFLLGLCTIIFDLPGNLTDFTGEHRFLIIVRPDHCLCRITSYNIIPVATPTFNDSKLPVIGIFNFSSQIFINAG